jgi:hypothetical protein
MHFFRRKVKMTIDFLNNLCIGPVNPSTYQSFLDSRVDAQKPA